MFTLLFNIFFFVIIYQKLCFTCIYSISYIYLTIIDEPVFLLHIEQICMSDLYFVYQQNLLPRGMLYLGLTC